MSNPAVIQLASLEEITGFPYRFEIEDNIGEAIHIHYKDIRLDMTIKEFNEFADSVRKIFASMVEHEKFHIEDFDAGNLMWLAASLIDLEDIRTEEMYLEDILVDTYDEEGKVVYKPLPNSRVLKALNGDTAENDARRQINYFHPNGWERQSNQERINYDLEQIKQYGYPVDGELIMLRGDNTIIDGQHRASCLYFLYGNIKVPVRKIYFKERERNNALTQLDQLNEYKYKLQMTQQKLFGLEQQYHNLDLALNEKDRYIEKYQKDIHEYDIALNEKDQYIEKYQKDMYKYDIALNEKDQYIENYQTEIKDLEKALHEKDVMTNKIKSELEVLSEEMSRIENSVWWKVKNTMDHLHDNKK